MKRVIILLAILLIAAGANAKGINKNDAGIQASAHPNGILFDVTGRNVDLQLDVSGPGKVTFSKRYAYAESVFFNVTESGGRAYPDGLYKYEARPVPAVTISRAESSQMKDRNVLYGKTDAKINPVSGTFRIVNGTVVDPNYDEYALPVQLPAEMTE